MEIQNCGRPIDSLLEKVLCMNILSSDYFKELYRLKTYHEVIDEIYNQVDHVEPWMTGNCRGPSTSFCLLYKFFTMKLTVKQMHGLLKHPDSPYIRAVGFLYLRYFADPKTLWNWFEPYVKDEEEFSPGSNGRMTTMGVYIRDLLLGQYYFDTLFPRIPVPVLRQVVANLEKLKLPTTHSGSTGESTRRGSDDTARRPPSVKASLSVSFGQRAPHRASTRDSSPIRRTVSHHERNGSDDPRRSPRRSSHIQSREYSDKDWDRERETSGDQSRARDRDRNHYRGRDRDRKSEKGRDRDFERDRETYRDRDRDSERDRRDRERDREHNYDHDKRSRYTERGHNDRRHYRSRSRSPSRSRSQSLQNGAPQFESGSKEKPSTSANLAKLKDIYGDMNNGKADANMERVRRRVNDDEEVIRLGGSTWKY
ncbi:pre-mRNA splicing factor SR-like 1 isoform X1 [Prosopis cineraria]|uniref:pre-mRNA splicing factor SR-like 1 isoform X1 n=1 Tax=Prosopis cineraria TaxID=364024 RepID=UPI00241061BE|nr:pre-mRNA splicing factor SR-like 1 isoform X1 [Prosopis cineraria]XP_054797313.1 pre-mRNA splicing factor SR-like 1 isoform X1 [Prosopis cineraria]XP_054797314.1 pre-mRNA splicing factor SR-like 1 isoform X1 [Prosopis cineraria]XP_054797315.1 pre-mRNA splicing factor SR-like 1 isoform X1 [Prosopis cineraria]XP_054797316.1 pre-mRNA splicing factor SR-like 1 isoform X1 [Prosopis cineraria]